MKTAGVFVSGVVVGTIVAKLLAGGADPKKEEKREKKPSGAAAPKEQEAKKKNEAGSVCLSAGDVPDLMWSNETWRKIRPLVDPNVPGSMPFKIYSGVNMSEQSLLWSSEAVNTFIQRGMVEPVVGLEKWNIQFRDMFDMIHAAGYSTFVYGGFLRDGFHDISVTPDDVDVLFTISVARLAEMCKERGYPYEVKLDEKTGKARDDYIAIGDKDAKRKFSGHTLDAGCAGEFRCNSLMYDVKHKVLVDPCGRGIPESVERRLCITFPRARWDEWATACDRLKGMTTLRFVNFRSRGFSSDNETEEYLVNRFMKLLKENEEDVVTCINVFKKRKLKVEAKRNKFLPMLESIFTKHGHDGKALLEKHFSF